jgi:hypothetical protein
VCLHDLGTRHLAGANEIAQLGGAALMELGQAGITTIARPTISRRSSAA